MSNYKAKRIEEIKTVITYIRECEQLQEQGKIASDVDLNSYIYSGLERKFDRYSPRQINKLIDDTSNLLVNEIARAG